MKWWLDGSVINDWTDGSSRIELNEQEVLLKQRAETSRAHAEYRVRNCTTEYDRIDAILALKRSMQTRLDHLDNIYGFKQYPQSKSVGWLGLLDQWGVIRKRVLRRMSQLRNSVEHDGAEPPDLEECEDYTEVNWWFLRATAPILRPMIDMSFSFEEYDLSVSFQYIPLKISLSGDFLPELISDSPLPGWIASEGKTTPASTRREGKIRLDAEITDPEAALLLIQRSFEEFM